MTAELASQRREHDAPVTLSTHVACRYLGQNYEQEVRMYQGHVDRSFELAIPIAPDVPTSCSASREGFHAIHRQAYGYDLPDQPIQSVYLGATASVTAARSSSSPMARPGPCPARPPPGRSWSAAGTWAEATILKRADLPVGCRVDGPAIIEEPDSTTYLPPGFRAEVHATSCLLLTDTNAAEPVHDRTCQRPAIDRVGLTLLHKQLVNICDEMAVSMMRTAYSPIFSEGLDFSTLILDRDGNLVATAGLNPAMLGASLYAATWIINEVGAENFDEGDVWIHNDPYRGGSHMPEHMMVTPDPHRRQHRGVRRQHRPHGRDRRHGAGFVRGDRDGHLPGRACGCRPCASSGTGSRSRTSGGSCSPTTARRPTRGATCTPCWAPCGSASGACGSSSPSAAWMP